eukprot:Filipodium_phascolosomae@DN2362_c0_g1_i1.p1
MMSVFVLLSTLVFVTKGPGFLVDGRSVYVPEVVKREKSEQVKGYSICAEGIDVGSVISTRSSNTKLRQLPHAEGLTGYKIPSGFTLGLSSSEGSPPVSVALSVLNNTSLLTSPSYNYVLISLSEPSSSYAVLWPESFNGTSGATNIVSYPLSGLLLNRQTQEMLVADDLSDGGLSRSVCARLQALTKKQFKGLDNVSVGCSWLNNEFNGAGNFDYVEEENDHVNHLTRKSVKHEIVSRLISSSKNNAYSVPHLIQAISTPLAKAPAVYEVIVPETKGARVFGFLMRNSVQDINTAVPAAIYILTDLALPRYVLNQVLVNAAEKSFSIINEANDTGRGQGHTSVPTKFPSMIISSEQILIPSHREKDSLGNFSEVVVQVMKELSLRWITSDSTSQLGEVVVDALQGESLARLIAQRAIVRVANLRSEWHGEDVLVGRILSVIGSELSFPREGNVNFDDVRNTQLRVWLNNKIVFSNGKLLIPSEDKSLREFDRQVKGVVSVRVSFSEGNETSWCRSIGVIGGSRTVIVECV